MTTQAKIWGYIRVSTDKQDEKNQRYELMEYSRKKSIIINDFVVETISSRVKFEKRELFNLINQCGEEDSILVTEYSRIGRDILEVMKILGIILNAGIRVHLIRQNRIFDNSIESKIFAMAMILAAEIERNLISVRTKEALARKKAEGVKLGRPVGSTGKSKLDDKRDMIVDLLKKGVNKSNLCRILECSRTTLDAWLKSREIIL